MTQVTTAQRHQARHEVQQTQQAYGVSDLVEAAAWTILNATRAFQSFQAALEHVQRALNAGRTLFAIVASFLFR